MLYENPAVFAHGIITERQSELSDDALGVLLRERAAERRLRLAAVGNRISAVVVTHNRLDKLQTTIQRLIETPRHLLSDIVVVDNASSDGTRAWLASLRDPRLTVHHSARNLGGAGGFAAGIRTAVEACDPDWVLVMDDDARPMPQMFERFHSAPRGQRSAWAAAVFHPSGALCEMNRPTRNPFWNAASFFRALVKGRKGFHLSDDEITGTQSTPIDAASFVGLFLSRGAIRSVGYPDANVFIYGDDVLYTLAIRKAGGRIEFDPALHFEHDCQSTGTIAGAGVKVFHQTWRSYYHHRNMLLVYRKAAGLLFWPTIALIVPRWLSLARHYGDNAPAFRRLLRAAIHDGLRRDMTRSHEEVLRLARPDNPQGATVI